MATRQSSSVSGNLRRLRLAAGLTQAQLAEVADVTDATISRIERGRFQPSHNLLVRLAAAVGASESDLVARKHAEKPQRLGPAQARLLATVRGWDDAAIDDLVRGIKLITAAAVRSAGQLGTPSGQQARGRRRSGR